MLRQDLPQSNYGLPNCPQGVKTRYIPMLKNRCKSRISRTIAYWSQRNSKLYDGETSFALKRQNHTCAACGHKFLSDEKVNLHHKDGNHANWKKNNLIAVHESCHDYLHMSKPEHREPDARKRGMSGSN